MNLKKNQKDINIYLSTDSANQNAVKRSSSPKYFYINFRLPVFISVQITEKHMTLIDWPNG